MTILDVFKKRGFIEDITKEKELVEKISSEKIICYIGFDPTASSLHVGSLVPIMSLAHMQRAGHKPIALVGGGTGLIGDPSGKTEMRQMLDVKTIEKNKKAIKKQLSNFIDFNDNKAMVVDNADWLTNLEYIPFLRDIGRCFSVNRMLKAESYKMRLDSDEGLNFTEFNYMLLQAYDYLKLSQKHKCSLQMGGSDQWGNIVAGIDLIRRITGKHTFGITFPLITTSNGIKMGKTHKGAIWLDKEKTSPYNYYQFWINTNDTDVVKFLLLFTFLPIEEIESIKDLSDVDLNKAKVVLAFEATKIAHGEAEAVKAFEASIAMFGKKNIDSNILKTSSVPRKISANAIGDSIPSYKIDKKKLEKDIKFCDLLHMTGLAKSKSAARRLIEQGGAYINNEKIQNKNYIVDFYFKKKIILRAGKKRYCRVYV